MAVLTASETGWAGTMVSAVGIVFGIGEECGKIGSVDVESVGSAVV